MWSTKMRFSGRSPCKGQMLWRGRRSRRRGDHEVGKGRRFHYGQLHQSHTRFQHPGCGAPIKSGAMKTTSNTSPCFRRRYGRTLHPDNMAGGSRFLRYDGYHGQDAFRRSVRRLLVRSRPRRNDGADRNGNNPW